MSERHHVDIAVFAQPLECLDAVLGEDETVVASPDPPPHSLQHKGFQVGLVVDYEDLAARLYQLRLLMADAGPAAPPGEGALPDAGGISAA